MTAAVAPTPAQVETTVERFSKVEEDKQVAPKLKDDIQTSDVVNETGGDKNKVTEDEFKQTLESEKVLEKKEEKLSDGQVSAVWNSAVVGSVKKDLTDNPVEQAEKDDFVEEKRSEAESKDIGITVDPDGRVEQLDTARGKIQEQISELEKGGVKSEEKALLAQLKEERNNADGKRQVLLSNGANIIVNGSSVVELNPKGEDYETELDGNFSSVYKTRKEAYEGYVQQYETSTDKKFKLEDNQSLIAYRREDGLYFRIVQSELKDDKQGDTVNGNKRVTAISDEISFTLETPGKYDAGVTMQIAGENPQNPTTGSWDPKEYNALEGESGKQVPKIGFSVYAETNDSTSPADPSTSGVKRYEINLNEGIDWTRLIIKNISEVEDEDEDGIPDYLEASAS